MTESEANLLSIAKLDLGQNDVLVVQFPEPMEDAYVVKLRKHLADIFGADRKVLILDDGVTLWALRKPE